MVQCLSTSKTVVIVQPMQPNIEMQDGEKWKEGDDVEVSLTYEALPTIPDVDFSKIKLQKLVVNLIKQQLMKPWIT